MLDTYLQSGVAEQGRVMPCGSAATRFRRFAHSDFPCLAGPPCVCPKVPAGRVHFWHPAAVTAGPIGRASVQAVAVVGGALAEATGATP